MKTLLPNSFKIVGYAVPILFFAIFSIAKAVDLDMFRGILESPEQSKAIFFSMLSLGLLFVVLARDKFEDERTARLRLDAVTFAFMWGVSQVLLDSLGIWPMEQYQSSSYAIALMLGVYLFMFEVKKRFA